MSSQPAACLAAVLLNLVLDHCLDAVLVRPNHLHRERESAGRCQAVGRACALKHPGDSLPRVPKPRVAPDSVRARHIHRQWHCRGCLRCCERAKRALPRVDDLLPAPGRPGCKHAACLHQQPAALFPPHSCAAPRRTCVSGSACCCTSIGSAVSSSRLSPHRMAATLRRKLICCGYKILVARREFSRRGLPLAMLTQAL
jgi:hypothetical protein